MPLITSQSFSPYCCPVCRLPLLNEGGSLRCQKAHSFDFHKSGYVNLLLSSNMKSKHPGDNKQMVVMRNTFLSKGYYEELKTELCKLVVEFFAKQNPLSNDGAAVVFDGGCGEGYYTTAVARAIKEAGLSAIALGVDISKEALRIAAKRCKEVHFAAASIFDVPIADESVDLYTLLFAPFAESEIKRVLKKGGVLIMVVPAARHLYELKEAVYKSPYENEVKGVEMPGFTLLTQVSVRSRILLDNQQDIKSLFLMTPYAYKTSKEDTLRMLALTSLETAIEFELLVYRKA